MLREYAVEPTLISDHHSARYFLEKFGCERGRLIGDFPTGWALVVLGALKCPPVKKAQVEVLLARAKAAIAKRQGATFDPAKAWLEQAIAEDLRGPATTFDAIVADGAEKPPKVVDGHSLDESDERWSAPTDLMVRRDSGDMADSIHRLLCVSRRVRFVDPYFDGRVKKSKSILEFIQRATAGHRHGAPTFEIHAANAKKAAQWYVDEGLAEFQLRLPTGVVVTYYQWAEKTGGEQFHNRYVITDVGGVEFGAGLDPKSGQATDRVSLLSEATRKQLWSRFDATSTAYVMDGPTKALKR